MESVFGEPTTACHIAVIPYPDRDHINSLLNFCKLLVTENGNITATFIVTEEWLGLIASDPHPDKIQFSSTPNVIPSNEDSAKDVAGFRESVWKMRECPCEKILDQLELPASLILADFMLLWAIRVGNRKKIPVSLFWPMSAMMFSVYQNYDLLVQNGHISVESSDIGHEPAVFLPGISSLHREDLARLFKGSNRHMVNQMRDAFAQPRAQYLLLSTIYELEPETIHDLKQKMSIPIYTVGPAIPSLDPENNLSNTASQGTDIHYLEWLDRQPCRSVLYVSMGSSVSVTIPQMDEIAAGLRASGVRFLWVTDSESERLKEQGFGQIAGGIMLKKASSRGSFMSQSSGSFYPRSAESSRVSFGFRGRGGGSVSRSPMSVVSDRGRAFPRRSVNPIVCYYCNKPGHIAQDCFARRDEMRKAPTVAQSSVGETPQQIGSGRGRGRSNNSSGSVVRPNNPPQVKVYAITRKEAPSKPDVITDQ